MTMTDSSSATKCAAGKSFFSVHTQRQLFAKAKQLVSIYGRGTLEKKLFEQHPELSSLSQSNKTLTSVDMMLAIKTYNLFLFRAMIMHRPDLVRQKHLSAAIKYNNFPAVVELINRGVRIKEKHHRLTTDPKMKSALVATDPAIKETIDQLPHDKKKWGQHASRLLHLLSDKKNNLSYGDFIRLSMLGEPVFVKQALRRTSLCIFYNDIQFMLLIVEQHRHACTQIPALFFSDPLPRDLWSYRNKTYYSFMPCGLNYLRKSPLGYRAVNATPLVIQPMLPAYFCDAKILGPELIMVAAGRDYGFSTSAILSGFYIVAAFLFLALIPEIKDFIVGRLLPPRAAAVRDQQLRQQQGLFAPGTRGWQFLQERAAELARQQRPLAAPAA